MPYRHIEDKRRASRESMRRRRSRHGGLLRGVNPDVNPVIYRDVNPSADLMPLAEMAPWARRKAIRTCGGALTHIQYKRNLLNGGSPSKLAGTGRET